MEKLPLVSIIIPLFNASRYLESMFAQLECQTYQNYEAVIINDGSKDDTATRVRKYMDADERIKLFEQENKGIGAARNLGLEKLSGSYFTFLDADDFLHPRYLEVLVKNALEHNADISICQIEQFNEATGAITASPDRFPAHAYPKVFNPKDYAGDLFGGLRTLAQAKLYRTEFIHENGIRFAPHYRTDDLPFTSAALASASRIALADDDLYTYRVNNPHSSTSTRAAYPLDFFESCKLLKKYLETHNLMGKFKTTYTQWVGLSCMLNLLELRDKDAYLKVYQALHNGGLKELGLSSPRVPTKAFGRRTASGAIEDTDVEQALSIIESNNEAVGTAKLLALSAKIKARKALRGRQTATTTAGTPLVSVLVPVYNAEPYLEQCLHSLMGQTFTDIEIICIDDGSTDTSPIILDAYAEQDKRLRVVHKENTGYGDSMNKALAEAHGIYIAICEPDDYYSPDMLKALSNEALKANCDIVKSNYNEIRGDGLDPQAIRFLDPYPYDYPITLEFCPQLLFAAPTIWTGLYRRQMLLDAGISFTPSPGASFQDLSYSQQCLIAAKSIYLLKESFYHYRTDNEQSSSNSNDKLYAVNEEYDRTMAFIESFAPEKLKVLAPWINVARMGNYLWNYNRISPRAHLKFAQRWASDITREKAAGRLNEDYFSSGYKALLKELLESPEAFCEHYPSEIERPSIM